MVNVVLIDGFLVNEARQVNTASGGLMAFSRLRHTQDRKQVCIDLVARGDTARYLLTFSKGKLVLTQGKLSFDQGRQKLELDVSSIERIRPAVNCNEEEKGGL